MRLEHRAGVAVMCETAAESSDRCGWCGHEFTPNECLFPIYERPVNVQYVIGWGCYNCHERSVERCEAGCRRAGEGLR